MARVATRKNERGLGEALSISRRGSWGRLILALMLVSAIPLLSSIALMFGSLPPADLPLPARIGAVTLTCALIGLGTALLARYPRTTRELRSCLEHIVQGEIPEEIRLAQDEDDVASIESLMNTLLFQTRMKITRIEHQREALMQAERQRVMLESIGAACHHLAQPATALTMHLELLRRTAGDEAQKQSIDASILCTEQLRETIEKLQRVSEYRTVPYLDGPGSENPDGSGDRILDI